MIYYYGGMWLPAEKSEKNYLIKELMMFKKINLLIDLKIDLKHQDQLHQIQ